MKLQGTFWLDFEPTRGDMGTVIHDEIKVVIGRKVIVQVFAMLDEGDGYWLVDFKVSKPLTSAQRAELGFIMSEAA